MLAVFLPVLADLVPVPTVLLVAVLLLAVLLDPAQATDLEVVQAVLAHHSL